MIRKIYGKMDPEEREGYTRLLVLEINSYLKKIYDRMGKRVPLKPQRILKEQIILKRAAPSATKIWEFRLNRIEAAAEGDVGTVTVITRALDDEAVRKQTALFIAAEYYVYHAFANNKDHSYFNSVRCQNQYWDMLKKALRMKNAHEIRDQAIQYVIEEIKEHRLAHYRGKGWFVSMAKLKQHHPKIASMLGSSEDAFKEILKKQDQSFTPDMLKQEEDLVRKEIEDIDHLDTLLKEHESKRGTPHTRKLINIHRANLKTFRNTLADIAKNLDRWVLVDKEEHKLMKKKLDIPTSELKSLLKAEAEAEQIDINKVHLVFNYFKKEKINILRDIELFDVVSAEKPRKHHKG